MSPSRWWVISQALSLHLCFPGLVMLSAVPALGPMCPGGSDSGFKVVWAVDLGLFVLAPHLSPSQEPPVSHQCAASPNGSSLPPHPQPLPTRLHTHSRAHVQSSYEHCFCWQQTDSAPLTNPSRHAPHPLSRLSGLWDRPLPGQLPRSGRP